MFRADSGGDIYNLVPRQDLYGQYDLIAEQQAARPMDPTEVQELQKDFISAEELLGEGSYLSQLEHEYRKYKAECGDVSPHKFEAVGSIANIEDSLMHLPPHLVYIDYDSREPRLLGVHPKFLEAFLAWGDTDTTATSWSLVSKEDVLFGVSLLEAGMSMNIDLAHAPDASRIHGWVIPPWKRASKYAIHRLKGRDTSVVATSVCIDHAHMSRIFDPTILSELGLTAEKFEELFSVPGGIMLPASEWVKEHYPHMQFNGNIQPIVTGPGTPAMRFISTFQRDTMFPRGSIVTPGGQVVHFDKQGVPGTMIVSTNHSGKFMDDFPYSHQGRGTHNHPLHILQDMGEHGLLTFRGEVAGVAPDDPQGYVEAVEKLHEPFYNMTEEELEAEPFVGVLSVTTVELHMTAPNGEPSRAVLALKRHGSTRFDEMRKRVKKVLGVDLIDPAEGAQRLSMGDYREVYKGGSGISSYDTNGEDIRSNGRSDELVVNM